MHLEAREIFSHALKSSSIRAAFDRHLRCEGRTLIRQSGNEPSSGRYRLDDYREIQVIALGKAALAMVEALLERLPSDIPLRGVCSAPSLPALPHPTIHYYAGGHPSPNADSFRAARDAMKLLAETDETTFVIFLISGGGSALFEAPLDPQITLAEIAAFHQALVGAGATIGEINTVRKHFSAVKGGRLAVAAPHAHKLSLLISDVPGNHIDALASAPTLPDSSTVEECREILNRYGIAARFPERIRAFFSSSELPETPGDKSRPRISAESVRENEIFSGSLPYGFAHSSVELLLSNDDLVQAAAAKARSLGFETVIDNSCDDWNYSDAAQYLLNRLLELRREYPRLCLLSGGEVTVRLEGDPGSGGRNQQFALACAVELSNPELSNPELSILDPADPLSVAAANFAAAGATPIAPSGGLAPDEAEGCIVVLSAGSDGVDGNSLSAGAIADPTTIARARLSGLDGIEALRLFDSYPIFSALGDSIVTGPTNHNLRDLRILLCC